MRLREFLCCLGAAIISALLTTGTATAQSTADDDRIPRFAAGIKIKENGDLLVTEEIDFLVSPGSRKRGIFRDFPTTYRDSFGLIKRVGFEVLKVSRNGRPEPYVLEPFAAGTRVRIGREALFLHEGVHRYRLVYRTDRQLLFQEDADELYWNVTGNDWAHTIERAEALVRLPAGAEPIGITAYTGYEGSQQRDFTQDTAADGSIRFATTEPLHPGYGLTIAVSWPKGYVTPAKRPDDLGLVVADNFRLLAGLAGLLITFGYFHWQWMRVGRDPDKGVIVPLFDAPEGLSPAATGFIWNLSRDQDTNAAQAFTVALTSLAIKGLLTIEERDDKSFVLTAKSAPSGKLPPGEATVMQKLFPDGTGRLVVEQEPSAVITTAVSALQWVLQREYDDVYFRNNRRFWMLGAVLGLVSVAVSMTASFGAIVTAFAIVFAVLLAYSLFIPAMLLQEKVTRGFFLALKDRHPKKIIIFLLSMPFAGIGNLPLLGGLYLVFDQFGPATFALCCAFFLLVLVYWYLLKAPTRLGRRVVEQIEGYRLYLSVAEGERLNLLTGEPEMTLDVFEHHLPYAMALDVERRWTSRFTASAGAAVLSQAEQPRRWHHTHRSYRGVGNLTSSLSSGLTSTLSSASTPPRSSLSSGFSSSGSSGGGGGGGGGGSW
ncbi:DUF2207 domain-containing protein [Pelagibius litoralis]|uniref:DUF2207 domain-containing protein n=1 Tax=Pelagibius litoralis TaxID=374515 RepID=A0A967C7K9_9PROT|nr:DUF2207 domain-containing protein [Pelagibius litoralis]NIA67837.1 DUF2207 domain-containing protein [Pelagibius litoralis]